MIATVKHQPRSSRRFRQRRGAVLVAAFVCLLIVMAMLGQLLLGDVQSGRQLHIERDRRQCDLLLQAGIARAVHRRSQDAQYMGESWKLPSPEILNQGDGVVIIEVLANENDSPTRLKVAAEYPAGSDRSVRRSHTITLQNESPSSAEE